MLDCHEIDFKIGFAVLSVKISGLEPKIWIFFTSIYILILSSDLLGCLYSFFLFRYDNRCGNKPERKHLFFLALPNKDDN